MKRRTTFAIVTVLLVAASLPAQMMGGRRPGMRNPGAGMTGGGMFAADMMNLPVASDGTVFVTRTNELIAVRPTGVIGWTYRLSTSGMTFAALAGTNVVLGTTPMPALGSTAAIKSQLIGVSIAAGSEQWKLDLDGIAMGVTPFADGVYLTVVDGHGAGWMGGTGSVPTAGRKLVAVSNAGKVLWTIGLD